MKSAANWILNSGTFISAAWRKGSSVLTALLSVGYAYRLFIKMDDTSFVHTWSQNALDTGAAILLFKSFEARVCVSIPLLHIVEFKNRFVFKLRL